MSAIPCPRCSKPTVEEKISDIPVDRCSGCGGLWLDQGELRPILDSRDRRFTADEVRATRSRHRKPEPLDPELACPRCGEKMGRFRYSGKIEIVLDQCARHGIWFDRDELDEMRMEVEERQIADRLKDERPVTIFDVARSLWS